MTLFGQLVTTIIWGACGLKLLALSFNPKYEDGIGVYIGRVVLGSLLSAGVFAVWTL